MEVPAHNYFARRPFMMRRSVEKLATTAHTFIFAMLPMILVLTGSGGAFPPLRQTASAFAFITAAVVIIFAALRPLGGSPAARAAATSAAIVAFSSYRTIIEIAFPTSAARVIERPSVALLFTLGCLLVGIAVRRPWDPSPRRTPMLSLLAIGMLALGTVPSVWTALTAPHPTWQPEADQLIQNAAASARNTRPERDVYVIVLDGLGRSDILRAMYGVDSTPLVTYLRANGFYVPDLARAPYGQTELSIPALLNLDYLDRVTSAIGPESSDRSAMTYLLARNAMMAAARRVGYDVIAVHSLFEPTAEFRNARGIPGPPGSLSEIQQQAIRMTPLAALPLTRWTHSAHRAAVLHQLDSLLQTATEASQGHRFVFAHVFAPHPPFLLNEDGSARVPGTKWLGTGDGSWFDGSAEEYRRGYAAQSRFILARIQDVVLSILSKPGPTPAILITGDHGPGSQLNWGDPKKSNVTERMSVFSAYLLPGVAPSALSPTLSPVSAARILANTNFGTNLPPLPDRSAFSTMSRPYDLIQLPPEPAN